MVKNIVVGYSIRVDQIFKDISSFEENKNIEIRHEKTLLAECANKEELIKSIEKYFEDE